MNILRWCALAALTSAVLYAQAVPSNSAFGSITNANAGCDGGSCVGILTPVATGSVSIQISGTWTGTLQFEQSATGATWTAITSTGSVTSATANGVYSFLPAGIPNIRVRASAFSSGRADVALSVSTAVSGGGSPTGIASGDLSSSYPGPTVAKLNGNAIPSNASGCLSNNGSGTLSWAACSASSAFSGLTAGTNTGAAMLVGTGASLAATGSGTIAATTSALFTGSLVGDVTGTQGSTTVAKILGNTVPANASGCLSNNGSGALSWAACTGGTIPNTTLVLKGNNAGAALAATAGTDYISPALSSTQAMTASLTAPNVKHSVIELGLKNDNSTDNCSLFTTANTTAATNGWTLYFPAGIYLTTCKLTLTAPGMVGDGAEKTIIRASGAFTSTDPVVVTALHDGLIRDINFDANNKAQDGLLINGGATHTQVQNIQATNPLLYGLECSSGVEDFISNSRMYITNGNAVPAGSKGIYYDGCTDAAIMANVTIGFETGIDIAGGNDRAIGNHSWYDPAQPSGTMQYGAVDEFASGSIWIGNEWDTPTVACIKTTGFNSKIIGNVCLNNSTYGTDNVLFGVLSTTSGPFSTIEGNHWLGGNSSHRFAAGTSITGLYSYWNNLNTNVVTTTIPNINTNRVALNTTTTMGGIDSGTSELSVHGSVTSDSDLSVQDSANTSAIVGLDFKSDIPRIRIGGSGTGTANGFQIQIAGDVPILKITNSGEMNLSSTSAGSGGFLTPLSSYSPSMATTGHMQQILGRDNVSNLNYGVMQFNYAADASNTNSLSFGTGNLTTSLNIFGTGHVSIGNTTDSDALAVTGNVSTSGVLKFSGNGSTVRMPTDGNGQMINNAVTGFTSLSFGPLDASHTQLRFGGTQIAFRTSDNSSWASLAAGYVSLTDTAGSPTAGAAAGSSPTITVAGHSNGQVISLTTGTSPTTGTLWTGTFSGTLSAAPGACMLQSGNAATAALASGAQPFIGTIGTGTYTVTAGATVLAASTAYKWNVLCF